jgi:hypothetical protein
MRRIEAVSLAVAPLDMCAGTQSAPTRVVNAYTLCRYTGVRHPATSRSVIADLDTLSPDQRRAGAPTLIRLEDREATSKRPWAAPMPPRVIMAIGAMARSKRAF